MNGKRLRKYINWGKGCKGKQHAEEARKLGKEEGRVLGPREKYKKLVKKARKECGAFVKSNYGLLEEKLCSFSSPLHLRVRNWRFDI